jgi:hypothetical protein
MGKQAANRGRRTVGRSLMRLELPDVGTEDLLSTV